MAAGNNKKAKETLDSAIESCKYLITTDQMQTEEPAPTRQMREENPMMFLGIVIMLALIIILVILYFVKYSVR
jgi:ABC-type microcin C transport system permease subunit YejE